jgi:hypothetical protein
VNHELARRVADAVLYEGYLLYPYRRSAIKNRQRWGFGILYPPAYPEVALGTERSALHSECLLQSHGEAAVQIELRFLHLVSRQYEQIVGGNFQAVPSLQVDGELFEGWDEPVEHSLQFDFALDSTPHQYPFAFPASEHVESVADRGGHLVGRVTRTQREVRGAVIASSEKRCPGVFKLTIHVSNGSSVEEQSPERNSALLCAMLSAHTILTATNAQFVSLLAPPPELREAAGACHNAGNLPVLVGSPPERDMVLCSPILLYDYPLIAPESASDFFDATEMDEMLTLRVMTLADAEKQEMRGMGGRLSALLQQTEENAREQLMRTHGVIRGMRRKGEQP